MAKNQCRVRPKACGNFLCLASDFLSSPRNDGQVSDGPKLRLSVFERTGAADGSDGNLALESPEFVEFVGSKGSLSGVLECVSLKSKFRSPQSHGLSIAGAGKTVLA